MKHLSLIIFVFTSIASIISCSDDDNASQQEIVATPEEFNALQETAWNNRLQTSQFDASSGISFTSDDGAIIDIAPNCLMLNGNAVTGMVDLELVELYNSEDMLVTNRTTMGRLPNADLAMLESGGSFYVSVSQNGEQLDGTNCNIQIRVPASLTGGPNNGMTLWTGTINDDNFLEWEEDDDDQNIFVEGNEYFTFPNDFGWINVDIFYSDPSPKTTILVDVPNGYTLENSAVYLKYEDTPNALAHLDTYNMNTGYFSEHYGQVPIGLSCHVIFVTEQDGQWLYAVKQETIEENEIITFTTNELQEATENQLTTIIGNL